MSTKSEFILHLQTNTDEWYVGVYTYTHTYIHTYINKYIHTYIQKNI